MWVSDRLFGFFQISQDAFLDLKERNAKLEAELAAVKSELATTKSHFGWLTTRVNSLELERAALLKAAYNVNVPAPEIAKEPAYVDPNFDPKNFSFEDVGDDVAKKLGLPVYGPVNPVYGAD